MNKKYVFSLKTLANIIVRDTITDFMNLQDSEKSAEPTKIGSADWKIYYGSWNASVILQIITGDDRLLYEEITENVISEKPDSENESELVQEVYNLLYSIPLCHTTTMWLTD